MKRTGFAVLIILMFASLAVMAGGDQENMTAQGEMEKSMPVPPPSAMGGEYVKPTEEVLRSKLNSLQYKVTQEEGTEPSYNNIYWDHKEQGIYVDIVSGEPLFSSTDKYDSRTGWPSFTKPLESGNIVALSDAKLGFLRIEVRSLYADSHLGHVFNDGPAPTGLRYCINSASLRFVPLDRLEEEGYGRYLTLFQ